MLIEEYGQRGQRDPPFLWSPSCPSPIPCPPARQNRVVNARDRDAAQGNNSTTQPASCPSPADNIHEATKHKANRRPASAGVRPTVSLASRGQPNQTQTAAHAGFNPRLGNSQDADFCRATGSS